MEHSRHPPFAAHQLPRFISIYLLSALQLVCVLKFVLFSCLLVDMLFDRILLENLPQNLLGTGRDAEAIGF